MVDAVSNAAGQFETILTLNKTMEELHMKHGRTLRRLAEGGLIAAMYTALTRLLAPLSFGMGQFRVAKMLNILPVFTPAAIPGLTVGCLLSNLLGLATGANVIGAWDLLLGPTATLLAAIASYGVRRFRVKGLPLLSTLPPVIFNAVAVGWELTFALFGFSWGIYGLIALQVAAGQLAACTVCGLLLYAALTRSGAAKAIFHQNGAAV